MPSFAVILFGVATLLAIAGLLLLRRAWCPRRSGATPHCRRCDYILTQNQNRCPECGSPISPSTLVTGDRHRRPALALLGEEALDQRLGLFSVERADFAAAIQFRPGAGDGEGIG